MHPVIQEICRAGAPIRPDVLRRWQRALRDEVQPRLDQLEAVEHESMKTKAAKTTRTEKVTV